MVVCNNIQGHPRQTVLFESVKINVKDANVSAKYTSNLLIDNCQNETSEFVVK